MFKEIVILLGGVSGCMGSGRPAAGFLDHVEGSVALCDATCSDMSQKLDKDLDTARILYVGDVLQCGADGKAFVRSPALKGKEYVNVCGLGITYRLRGPSGGDSKSQAGGDILVAALTKYGTRAGRDKGSQSPIYSPPENGAVIASKLVVSWRTRPPLRPLSVILRGSGDAELARVDHVDGAAGTLDSEVIRQAVVRYRDAAGSSAQLKLVFRDDSGIEQAVGFSVLTAEQERSLANEVRQVDAETGLVKHVERAGVFESFRLYGMVAEEYDAALEVAPKSRDLLEAAFNANARIGNLRRARDLRDKLQEIEPAEK